MTAAADDLTLALDIADMADELTLPRFGAMDLLIDTKPDLTPVTDVDRSVESAVREVLSQQRPADAVLGEEYGGAAEFTGRQWVIDPIDGTKNFIRGVPVWATLVALLVDGVPVTGVVSAPAMQRRWWASAGRGAYAATGSAPGRRIAVSAVGDLSAASLSFSSLSRVGRIGPAREIRRTDRCRVAGSRIRRLFSPTAWSPRAPSTSPPSRKCRCGIWPRSMCWCGEAGGTFSSLDGRSGPHGGSAVATNGLLHDEVIRSLDPS